MSENNGADPPIQSQDATEELPGSSVHWRRVNVAKGEVLADRFRVAGRLGRGSMGAVFKAWDKTLKKYVALKFRLARDGDSEEQDTERRQRFLNEVKKAQQISHPNICRIHDVWTAGDREFISMEFIDGEDLEKKLLREGKLKLEEAVGLALEICAGLGAIHSQGLFHQDLKPANVMIDHLGGAKISDFGLADQYFQGGTRRYAPPEQLIERKVHVQSDLFSLGLILYEMLTGRRGFQSDCLTESMPKAIRSDHTEVPPDLEAVIFQCLQRDPSLRPKSVGEIEEVLARSGRPWDGPDSRESPVTWKVVLPILLVLLAGSAFMGVRWLERDTSFDVSSLGEDDVLPPWVKTYPTLAGETDWAQDGSRLVEVGGGEYVLGTEDLDADSRPVHRVILSLFWITKVPITHAQYEAYLESQPQEPLPKFWKNVERSEAWQPVVGATWDAARKYCRWAGMDLPTEAQWEAAVRGKPEQERYPYPWGSEPPSSERAYFTDANLTPTSPERVGTFPLGAGPFGALDQVGNVWEWCRDGWNARAYDGRDGSEDPLESFEAAGEMVVRGGSYLARARDLHLSYRASLERDRQNEQTGFRCVYEPTATATDMESSLLPDDG